MIFQKMIEQCGLNQIEAAEFLGYSFGSVKKWALEKRRLPDDVVHKLAKLDNQIDSISSKIAAELQTGGITTNGNTTSNLLNKFHTVLQQAPTFDSVKETCLARAFMIADDLPSSKTGDTK